MNRKQTLFSCSLVLLALIRSWFVPVPRRGTSRRCLRASRLRKSAGGWATDTPTRPRPGNDFHIRRRQPHSRRSRRILPCRRITLFRPIHRRRPKHRSRQTRRRRLTLQYHRRLRRRKSAAGRATARTGSAVAGAHGSVGKRSCAMGAPTLASRRTSGSASPSQMRVGMPCCLMPSWRKLPVPGNSRAVGVVAISNWSGRDHELGGQDRAERDRSAFADPVDVFLRTRRLPNHRTGWENVSAPVIVNIH